MTSEPGPLRIGPTGPSAKALCVFVHGRGQTPEDMEAHVLARLGADDIAFVLPRAPKGAWYQARAVDPLTPVARAELATALDHLAAAVAAARSAYPGLPLLLAGFSQGACLAIEYVCAGLPAPEALAALTGCRVGVPADGRARGAPRGLPVYLSGADADPWIPAEAAADAIGSLAGQGAVLRADLFPGRPHEVSDTEIAMLRGMLDDVAAGRTPRMEAPR
ncbi:phospholipase [Kaistia geumhonensis]|uniref:Phospholipase/carboxylesterase n=1 Tax=Kaistia geumhonensis TaxID=410839 RepID=A0ABU0M547_9HYPH|nr:phospholipase [Kaistia geumhonensis]MCX5478697.1 phospholipase [Kaistia geumhonensis]MDQ0516085.1 phospholipase/carboxylesterase [Kaistia geumhonensis]